MNIFILDRNPKVCAQYHLDKHVVKMPLETAQLLCTAITEHGGPAKYKVTHKNHPCNIWTRQSRGNFVWLVELGWELCREYQLRYGRCHACLPIINDCLMRADFIPEGEITEFVQAMPDEYKRMDPVDGYRAYYTGAKWGFATWKNRMPPSWWLENVHEDLPCLTKKL
jgi:hypothetical protein